MSPLPVSTGAGGLSSVHMGGDRLRGARTREQRARPRRDQLGQLLGDEVARVVAQFDGHVVGPGPPIPQPVRVDSQVADSVERSVSLAA